MSSNSKLSVHANVSVIMGGMRPSTDGQSAEGSIDIEWMNYEIDVVSANDRRRNIRLRE